jgi:hypothetical protein
VTLAHALARDTALIEYRRGNDAKKTKLVPRISCVAVDP